MEKRSFRWLRRLGRVVLGLVSGLVILYFIFNEKIPKGTGGPVADQLAHDVQKAINYTAWDSTEAVQWTFKGMHTFLWDKKRHWVKVNWKDYEAVIRIDSVDGCVWKNNEVIESEKKKNKLLKKALHYWMNDSFWLNAPAKIFDKGTERKIVNYKGEKGLLVTYTSGGATPGDSYLWLLDENNLPKSWKLWVKIIPIGGVEFTWEKWETVSTGAKIATLHNGLLELDISNLKAGKLSEFGKEDPFDDLTRLD